MTAQMTMVNRIEWAAKLAALVAPDRTMEATEVLQKIVVMLDGMPDRCFTSRGALDAVASCKRRTIVPALADVRAALMRWLQDNPEYKSDGSLPEDWKPSEHRWLEYWYRRAAENFKPISDIKDQRGNLLDLIRCQSPRVYEYIQREVSA